MSAIEKDVIIPVNTDDFRKTKRELEKGNGLSLSWKGGVA